MKARFLECFIGITSCSLVAFTLTTPAMASGSSITSSMKPAGTYKLQYILLTTEAGVPNTSDLEIYAYTSVLDAAYNQLTKGHFRFAVDSISRETLGQALGECGRTSDLSRRIAPLYPAVPGGIRVFIFANATCGAYAASPGDYVVIGDLSSDPTPDIETLFHEIGHTLGLPHANSFLYAVSEISFKDARTGRMVIARKAQQPKRDNPYQTWVHDVPQVEYGDRTSAMGSSRSTEMQLSAYELDLLGSYESDQVGAAIESGTFTISDRYASSGISLLYIPDGNARQAAVEMWNIPSDDGIVRGGVMVRALFWKNDRGSWGEGMSEQYNPDGHAVMQPSKVSFPDSVFLDPANRMDLPDGTSIIVLSRDRTSAKVQVTRPPDKLAPEILMTRQDGCEPAELSCTIYLDPGNSQVKLAFDLNQIKENRWLAEYGVKIDGALNQDVIYPAASTPQLISKLTNAGSDAIEFSLASGKHQVEYFAVDAAGNRSSIQRTITVLKRPIVRPPSAPYDLKLQSRGKTGATISWSFVPEDEVEFFRVEFRTQTGKWKLAGKLDANSRRIILKGLKRGTLYYVQIFSINSKGRSDSGWTRFITSK